MRAIQGHQDITVIISNAHLFSEVCVCLLFILSSRVQITDSSMQSSSTSGSLMFSLCQGGLQTKSNPHQQRKVLRVLVKWDDCISIHDQRKVNGTRGFGWYKLPNYSGGFFIEDHSALFVLMA